MTPAGVGGFSDSWRIKRRTKNALSRLDGHLGPLKMASVMGVRQKHEEVMKNRCENERFLMARNHVWRYTLRLFHTFAPFENNRKICAKREPQNWFLMKNRSLDARGSQSLLRVSTEVPVFGSGPPGRASRAYYQ